MDDIQDIKDLLNIEELIKEEFNDIVDQLNDTDIYPHILEKLIKSSKSSLKYYFNSYKIEYVNLLMLLRIKRELEAKLQ